MGVDINLFLKRIGQAPFWRFGRIQRAAVERTASELVREFDVRTPGLKTRAATLSGGNIQKLLLARELSFDPKVVVFNKPTYGLDLKTTHAVRDAIRELADDGRAALVISTDLDELLEICDRIAVISRGRLVGLIENGPGAAEQIGALMVGVAGRASSTAEVTAAMSEPRRGQADRQRALRPRADRRGASVDVTVRSFLPGRPRARRRRRPAALPRREPAHFYRDVWQRGIEHGTWQDSAIRMAPLLLIAAGLTVIFRANIWNLGYDGQFLLGAALVSGFGPSLMDDLPMWLAIVDPVRHGRWRPARPGRSSRRS